MHKRYSCADSNEHGCLQGDAETRFAMKTLEKREMVERNKVLLISVSWCYERLLFTPLHAHGGAGGCCGSYLEVWTHV
jgi:hypothetical protein